MQFLENEICDYTEKIWESTLGLRTNPTEENFPSQEPGNSLAGCVHITGSWEGTVELLCPKPLAQQAAKIMFNLKEQTARPEDIQDALGELTNMTGGNIKSLLPEPCHLSLPAVAVTDQSFRIPGSDLVTQVNFKCNGHFFQVSLLKRVS